MSAIVYASRFISGIEARQKEAFVKASTIAHDAGRPGRVTLSIVLRGRYRGEFLDLMAVRSTGSQRGELHPVKTAI